MRTLPLIVLMLALAGVLAPATPVAAAPPTPGKGTATVRVVKGVEAICSEQGGHFWTAGDVMYTADTTQKGIEITDEPLLAGGVTNLGSMQLNQKTLEGVGWGEWTFSPTALKGRGRWEGTYTYAFSFGQQPYSEIQGVAKGTGKLRGMTLMVRAHFAPELKESLRGQCGGSLPIAVTDQTFWITELQR